MAIIALVASLGPLLAKDDGRTQSVLGEAFEGGTTSGGLAYVALDPTETDDGNEPDRAGATGGSPIAPILFLTPSGEIVFPQTGDRPIRLLEPTRHPPP